MVSQWPNQGPSKRSRKSVRNVWMHRTHNATRVSEDRPWNAQQKFPTLAMVSATMSTRSFPIATIYTVRRLHIRRPRPLIFSLGRVRCSCGPSHNPLWGGGDMQLTDAGYLHRRAALDIWPARRPIIRDVRAVPPTWKAAYWKARRTVSQWAVFARRRSDRNWPGQQLTFGNSCPSLVAQGQLCLVLRFLTINIPMTSCRLLYHPGPWAHEKVQSQTNHRSIQFE